MHNIIDVVSNEETQEILLLSKDPLSISIVNDGLEEIFSIPISHELSAKPFFNHTFIVYADNSGTLSCVDKFSGHKVSEQHLNGFATDQIIHYKENIVIFPLVVPVQVNKAGLSHYCVCEFSLNDFSLTKHPLRKATMPKLTKLNGRFLMFDSKNKYEVVYA